MEGKDRKYSNDDITVHWKPSECIHSTICYKNLIEVFNPSSRPWVNMRGASTDKITDIVKRCPTNALTYTWNDGRPSEKPPEELAGPKPGFEPEKRDQGEETIAKLEIIKGGPLLVEGQFKIFGPDGKEINKKRIAFLCRCGGSKNMPFCDGTHRKLNFDK